MASAELKQPAPEHNLSSVFGASADTFASVWISACGGFDLPLREQSVSASSKPLFTRVYLRTLKTPNLSRDRVLTSSNGGPMYQHSLRRSR